MKSLTTLIREANDNDPLARAVEAVLDAGLVVFTRDTSGRFVHLSKLLTDRAGLIAPIGGPQPVNMRVFNEEGRLLAGSEYPTSIARTTGAAQRDVLTRVVSDDGRHVWLKMNAMPLERGPDGWSVLTIATDVTELQDGLEAARREVAGRGALLDLSVRLARRQLPREELFAACGEALATLLPEANASIALRDGNEYQTTPIAHGFGIPAQPLHGHYTVEELDRPVTHSAHVNLDVQNTDIYGANVVVEFANAMRSLVIAPCIDANDQRIGAVVAYSDQPNAFTADQVASLEFAAGLVAAVLDISEPLAQAS